MSVTYGGVEDAGETLVSELETPETTAGEGGDAEVLF